MYSRYSNPGLRRLHSKCSNPGLRRYVLQIPQSRPIVAYTSDSRGGCMRRPSAVRSTVERRYEAKSTSFNSQWVYEQLLRLYVDDFDSYHTASSRNACVYYRRYNKQGVQRLNLSMCCVAILIITSMLLNSANF